MYDEWSAKRPRPRSVTKGSWNRLNSHVPWPKMPRSNAWEWNRQNCRRPSVENTAENPAIATPVIAMAASHARFVSFAGWMVVIPTHASGGSNGLHHATSSQGYGSVVVSRYLGPIVVLAAVAAGCSSLGASVAPDNPDSPSTTTLPPVTTLPDVSSTTTVSSTSTTQAPPSSTTTEPVPSPAPRSQLVVSGTGDVNLDPAFVRSVRTEGFADAWTGLFGAFLADDLTIVNLECSPTALGTPWDKPWTFRCDPAALPAMAAAGVDVANLANNHGTDFGFEGMLDGMNNLRAVGIAPVGTGADIDEAYQPFTTEINGWRIAVIGSGGVNPETGSWLAGDDRPGMTHGNDTESIAEAVRTAKQSADLVFVTAHWGEQGTSQPRPFERRQAEAWIEAGADGIFGHHQHVLQPLEFYQGKPIAWGLGNFVWQAYPAESKRTAIAQFVYEPDGRIGACLIPVVIERTGHPVIQDPEAAFCAPEGGF
jgi:Bacterial capsule synthesis protein PGA_cap